jgi:hypothetical protein
MNTKFLLASMKTPPNFKKDSKSRIRISVPAFLLSHWSIFSGVHVIGGFRNNFRNPMGLLKHFFKVRDGFLYAATSSLKRVTGRISK